MATLGNSDENLIKLILKVSKEEVDLRRFLADTVLNICLNR